MLHAVGFTRADFAKPQVGICSTWSQVTPCNMHIDQLAKAAAAGVDAAGAKAVIFNTITVSDGISMGSEGMRYSLVSREVIADSIETVAGAEGFDGLVTIGGCDKNMPACAMAIARLDRPAVFVYGGTILPGHWRGQPVDIVSVFEAVGQHAAGRITDADLADLEQHACPGAGSCGGMYTANTMASAIEALGLSLPNSSAQAATSAEKLDDCRRAGAAVARLVADGLTPRRILTRKAFENAITVVVALGGSTNAVLHLLAIASAAGVKLTLDDFTRVGRRVPVLADLRPSGKYVMAELVRIGGLTPLMKRLLDARLLHGDVLTVTGRTLAENLADAPDYPAGQDVVRGLDAPVKRDSHLVVLRGNLAPEGAVAKISGKEGERFTGPRGRLRPRGRRPRRHPRRPGQGGARGGDPLRRPAGRPRHARDAVADQRAHRPRPRRRGGAHHRRPLLGRDARLRGRPRDPRGRRRRADRRWSSGATRSPSTPSPGPCTSTCRRGSWPPGGGPGARSRPRRPAAPWPSTPGWCPRPAKGRSPTCPARPPPPRARSARAADADSRPDPPAHPSPRRVGRSLVLLLQV